MKTKSNQQIPHIYMTITEHFKKFATMMVSWPKFLITRRGSYFYGELRTEITIDNSAEIVWSILMDFEEFPNWNPLIRRVTGEAIPGRKLTIFIKPEGVKGMTFEPMVTIVEKNREFRWLGKLGLPGIFNGEHIFQIEQSENSAVLFVHREKFSGFLVPVLLPMIRKGTLRGFNDMNSCLKLLSERWVEKPNCPERQHG